MNKQPCIECGNKTTYYTRYEDYVCTKCRLLDKYTLITKTNAKKLYLLTDDELQSLQSYNSIIYHKLAIYYTKYDLITCIANKYSINRNDVDNKLNELLAQKELKKQQRINNKSDKRELRKNKLIEELNNVGLDLRNDSVLCKKYIDGDKTHELKFIVQRMCQMKYLFDYCHMEECKQQVYNEFMDDEDNYYYRGMVTDYAETMALKKYSNGKYPEVYPWM